MTTFLMDAASPAPGKGKLLRILGVGFGLAAVIGGTIGGGILRSPGAVADKLGSTSLIMLVWLLGGLYSLLGANYTAELATMIPKAGGPYVYARRALGDYGGFVIGWSDWLLNTAGLAYLCIIFGEYATALIAPNAAGGVTAVALLILLLMGLLNLLGTRTGSGMQKITSTLKAVALIGFVVACFAYGGHDAATETAPVAAAHGPLGTVVAVVLAVQLVLGTYSGWNTAIYFAEEDVNPEQNMVRALFGGTLMVMGIYLLVNLALLYVLPMATLAGSTFAGADAMGLIFGRRSGQIVTMLGMLSVVGIINANVMVTPRVLLALGRDGLFTAQATTINRGGTPVFGLLATVVPAAGLVLVGSFETLLAVSEFFGVVLTVLLVVSLFILRRREPDLPRPFRAWGYPWLPLLALVLAIALLFGYIFGNPTPSLYSVCLLVVSYPIFRLTQRTADGAA